MTYYHSKRFTDVKFSDIKSRILEELSKEGFGVVSEIDIQATMKQKLNKEYPPHLILGACNPVYADQILSIEPTINTLLPCNVTIRSVSDNEIEVAVVNPKALLSIVDLPEMVEMAAGVEEQLINVLERL